MHPELAFAIEVLIAGFAVGRDVFIGGSGICPDI